MAVIISVYPIPRKECVAAGCNCRDAVFGDQFVTVPLSAADLCNCGHPYWQHKGSYSPEGHGQRGGMVAGSCGGFFPMGTGIDVDRPGNCICSAPYHQHDAMLQAPVSQPTRIAAAIAASPPTNAFRTAERFPIWVPNGQASGTPEQRRQASAARHRQRGGGSRRGRRTNATAQGSQATASTSSRNALNASDISPSAPITLNASGGESAGPAQQGEFEVVLLPFTIEQTKQNESIPEYLPTYVFRRRQFAAVIKALTEAQFTFRITISPTSVVVWQQLDQEIHAHIKSVGLYLPRKQRDNGQEYEYLSWDLLTPARNKSGGIVVKNDCTTYTTAAHDVACYQFTLEHLQNMSQTHPFDMQGLPLLLVVPLAGHIEGSVQNTSTGSIRHPCKPWRVLAKTEWLYPEGDGAPKCFEGLCPDEDPLPDEAVARKRRGSTPEAQLTLPTTRMRHTEYTAPIDVLRLDAGTTSQTAFASTERWERPKYVKMSSFALQMWQDRFLHQGSESFHLRADTKEDLVEAYINTVRTLIEHRDDPDFVVSTYAPQPYSVECTLNDKTGLLNKLAPFQINQGIGNGPSRLIYRQALQSRIQTQTRWNSTWDSIYYTLSLYPVSDLTPEETLIEYEVDGALAALMMLHLAVEPYPISPLVLLASCYPSGCQMGREARFYESIIPDQQANETVSAWLRMKSTDEYGSNTPVAKVSAGLLGLSPFFLEKPRSDKRQENMTIQIISHIIAGYSTLWSHPQFLAFRRGFNLEFLGLNGVIAPNMNYSAERDKEIYQLLYTIYDQRIHSAKKVLECTVFQGGSSKQPEVDDIYKLFMACFIRWINGHGHPIELVGDFIEKTTYLAALPDSPPVTRAQLFFEALSDSNLLPITGFTEIMVSLKYAPTMESERPVRFHTCAMEVGVVIDKHVLRRILDPRVLQERVSTEFDLWWHLQVMHACGHYNES